jgi:predicted O-methyltransferase YrrM
MALTQLELKESSIEFAAATVLDRVALAALVRRQRPQRVFEIGTFRGVTAITMAANAPSDAIVYTLDLPPALTAADVANRYGKTTSGFHRMAAAGVSRDVGRVLSSHTTGCRIEQLLGDSASMDFDTFHDTIDLFFVDGCHDYEAALGDTRTAWRCLRAGGLLVWHDYPWPDVQTAIRDAALGVPVTCIRDTNLAFASKR